MLVQDKMAVIKKKERKEEKNLEASETNFEMEINVDSKSNSN